MRIAAILFALLLAVACRKAEQKPDYPYQPVPFTQVKIADEFWAPRIEVNRTVTIPAGFQRCEETGRIDNFLIAAGNKQGEFVPPRYNDSDVYKMIEGASYSLAVHPDPALERYLDELIGKIGAAQEPDGYLFTARSIHPNEDIDRIGKTRWSNLIESHELYNAGHLYEAAAAHYQATGKRSLLEVALKNADLVCRTFGAGKLVDVPGHEEIEIGLVKLYRVTGDPKYLATAKFFVDERGDAQGHKLQARPGMPGYSQDHLPVVQQREAVGHAVRAGYFYTAVADIAALTGQQEYVEAIDRIWNNVVSKKTYLTGGVGARRKGEAFGDNYELPNATAYNETCAAIANALWNERLFLLHGDAKYIDTLERVLYNGILSGVSLSGDRFFYPNPLAADGKYKFNQGSGTRQPWFRTSCCPTNIARFMPSIPGYIYATRGRDLYVNLFIGSEARIRLGEDEVRLRQQTQYPWDGAVKITVESEAARPFAINVRIPGWARNQPIPSDLYRFATTLDTPVSLQVNGEAVPVKPAAGYVRLERAWESGDSIELRLPMPVRRVLANEQVKDDAGRVALERGPLVYCVEGIDNGGTVSKVALADTAALETEPRPDLLGGVTVVKGPGLVAIPYYAWSNRGEGDMQVWLPRKPAG